MSGPKCSRWEVEENLRQIERARQAVLAEAERARKAALANADALADEVERLVASVETLRASTGAARSGREASAPRRPGRNDSHTEIEQLAANLRGERARLNVESAQLAAAARLADFVAATGAANASAAAVSEATQRARRVAEAETRAKDASRILSRIPEAVSQQEMEALKLRAEAYVSEESPGAARGLELELRHKVQALQDLGKAQLRDIQRAGQLRAQLLGLEGREVSLALAQLESVERGEKGLDASLAGRIPAVVEQARKASDRAYAMEVLRSEFQALGYEVGEEFATVFMEGGAITVSRPDHTAYAVEISVSAGEQELNTRLVSVSQANLSPAERRLRDKEAEESWCEDYARILAGAAKQKVRARVTRRLPPGAEAVPMVAAALSAKPRRRQTVAPKTNSLGRG